MLTAKTAEIAGTAPTGSAGEPPRAKYERLIATAKQVPPATTVVVYPCDETSLRGAVDAAETGIIKPVLVGPAANIAKVARQSGVEIAAYPLVENDRDLAVHQRQPQLLPVQVRVAIVVGMDRHRHVASMVSGRVVAMVMNSEESPPPSQASPPTSRSRTAAPDAAAARDRTPTRESRRCPSRG